MIRREVSERDREIPDGLPEPVAFGARDRIDEADMSAGEIADDQSSGEQGVP